MELRNHGIRPSEVILYGSYAKGEATPLSDIDLIIVSDDLSRWPAIERLEMLSRLAACVDAPLEVLGYTPDEIAKAGKSSILWAEISRYGRRLKAA
ncbi:MAG: nucleotidyltransferase domain-containing protein [Deltaproteobacteria bacterium]|nr:nucleotidyltransferase domain-containing protein [Deltaproteobacteria bacterium]